MELPRIRTTLVGWIAIAVVSTTAFAIADGWPGLAAGLLVWLAAGTTLAVAVNATRKAALTSRARLAAAVEAITSELEVLRSGVADRIDQGATMDGRLEDRIEEMAAIVGRLAAAAHDRQPSGT